MKFSLWLVPARGSPPDKALRTTMGKIVAIYATPAFPPHVTLIAEVEGVASAIKEKTAAIAARLTSYEILFNNVNAGESYYKKLYLQVAPSTKVMNANVIATEILGIPKRDYLPHCSLAYGDITTQEVAEMQIKYVSKDLANKASFTASRIQLWNTDGSPKDWRPVAWFSLGEA